MTSNEYLINNTLALKGILSELDACGLSVIGMTFGNHPENHLEIHCHSTDACHKWMRIKGAEIEEFHEIYPYQAIIQYPNQISVFCLLTEEEKQEMEEIINDAQ